MTDKKIKKKKSLIENAPDPTPSKPHDHSGHHEINDKVHNAIHDSIDIIMQAISKINSKHGRTLTTEDVMFSIYMVGSIIALQGNKTSDEIIDLFDNALLQAVEMGNEISNSPDLDQNINDEDVPRLAPAAKLVKNDKSK